MSKHTPGPWEYLGSTWVHTADDKKTPIANFNFFAATESNARIIAAAPELFDVLKDVVELWNHHCYAHGDGNPTPLHSRARAAVNKAQGIST